MSESINPAVFSQTLDEMLAGLERMRAEHGNLPIARASRWTGVRIAGANVSVGAVQMEQKYTAKRSKRPCVTIQV